MSPFLVDLWCHLGEEEPLRKSINNRGHIKNRPVVYGGTGLFAPIRHLLPPPGSKRDISLYHRLEQHLEGVSIRARAGKDRLGLPVGVPRVSARFTPPGGPDAKGFS